MYVYVCIEYILKVEVPLSYGVDLQNDQAIKGQYLLISINDRGAAS